jgi:chromosome segregation ATPase
MTDQATSVRASLSSDRGREEIDQLREELARSRQEVLRLRDLLIGKDAELGALKGRAAELEDHSRRLANVASRLQSRIPGAMRLAGAALRRLSRRQG